MRTSEGLFERSMVLYLLQLFFSIMSVSPIVTKFDIKVVQRLISICGNYQNEIESFLESARIRDTHFIYITPKNRNKMPYYINYYCY